MTKQQLIQMLKEYSRQIGEFILPDDPTEEELAAGVERARRHMEASADHDGISMIEIIRETLDSETTQ